MVFSSIPPYLDPPNWQQQRPNFGNANYNDLLPPVPQQSPIPPPPPPPPQHHGVGGAGSIRPGSMVDQARMANIPMPETALKCPRCESTHTKFCYFNNYSLSQPRHFCKTCRRYWTRGGALRSVPVGGGCRRNKRSCKSSNTSKSEPANSGSSNSTLPCYNNTTDTATATTSNILGGLTSQIPQVRFMSPLTHHLMDYGSTPGRLNYGGISGPMVSTTSEMNFQIGSNLFSGSRDGGVPSLLCTSGGGGLEQWRMQQTTQFPNFLGGFDPSISHGSGVSLYHINNQDGGVEASKSANSSSMMSQLASVKMEANNNQNHKSNSARQFSAGPVEGNEHHWSSNIGTSAWTDLSGFSSSSTTNIPM